MRLQAFTSCITVLALRCTAENTPSASPSMLCILEPDISLHIIKLAYRIHTVGILAAVQASPGKQAGQFRDGNAVKLIMEDVVNSFLQVREYRFQADQQPLCDFTQEHPAFTGGIQEFGIRIAEQFLRQHIQHGVCHIRRCENFVVAEVCYAGQHVRIVYGVIETDLFAHTFHPLRKKYDFCLYDTNILLLYKQKINILRLLKGMSYFLVYYSRGEELVQRDSQRTS